MTPFGARIRELRKTKGYSLEQLALKIGVSTAYLSSLERGNKGRPGWHIVQRIINELNIIWDDAEEIVRLAEISHPRITIDTSQLSPAATELANLLGQKIALLSQEEIASLLYMLKTKRL